jgi:hypothetical protein
MIWNAALHCTLVARDSVMVSRIELWITRENRQIEWR